MPTRNISLTPELDSFIAAKIQNGRYENASEVVRAALRNLEREEQEYEAKFAAVLKAIDDGEASGIAEGDVFEQIRQSRRLRHSSVTEEVKIA
jgi:antitoxin ParD1/3/4